MLNMLQVLLITHPQGLYLICKLDPEDAAQGWSNYKTDTNWMGVLYLLYFMVREWIKGATLCLAQRRMTLYCLSCVGMVQGWSWWKALGFHPVKLEQIYYTRLNNPPFIRTLFKHTFDATITSRYLHRMQDVHSAWLIICATLIC